MARMTCLLGGFISNLELAQMLHVMDCFGQSITLLFVKFIKAGALSLLAYTASCLPSSHTQVSMLPREGVFDLRSHFV